MDRLAAMQSFVRTVERGSFAAATLSGLSPAMVGNHVRFLEAGDPVAAEPKLHFGFEGLIAIREKQTRPCILLPSIGTYREQKAGG